MKDVNKYHEAISAAWRFFRENSGNAVNTDEWWDEIIKKSIKVYEPFHDTEADSFALAMLAAVIDELKVEAAGFREFEFEKEPANVSITYGSLEEAVNRIRAAEGLTEVSYTDRGGRRKVIVNIREENHDA